MTEGNTVVVYQGNWPVSVPCPAVRTISASWTAAGLLSDSCHNQRCPLHSKRVTEKRRTICWLYLIFTNWSKNMPKTVWRNSPVLLVGTLLLILAICFQAEILRNEVTRKINKKTNFFKAQSKDTVQKHEISPQKSLELASAKLQASRV